MTDSDSGENSTLAEQTREFHQILHDNFPDRPDVCILTTTHMVSCPEYLNFQYFFEDAKLDGTQLISDILESKFALLRFQFSTVLLQLSAYMIRRIDEEEDMGLGSDWNDNDGEEGTDSKKKVKLTKDFANEFCDLVIPIYTRCILNNRYGPKELNLVLGILCNLSRLERGLQRILQEKLDEELDDDELDNDDSSDDESSSDDEIESLPEDGADDVTKKDLVAKKGAGKFVPWLCKRISKPTEEEKNMPSDDTDRGDIIEVSAEHLDTFSRCIQLILNVTKTEKGRNFILMKRQEVCLSTILTSVPTGPLLRRKGCVQVIRNCLLVKEQHPIIAGINFIEPFLDRLEKKAEKDDALRRDIAECIYILSFGNQVVKVSPHRDRIQEIHDSIQINVAEKRLLKMAIEQAEGRTEAVKEGDFVSYDERTGQFKKVM